MNKLKEKYLRIIKMNFVSYFLNIFECRSNAAMLITIMKLLSKLSLFNF